MKPTNCTATKSRAIAYIRVSTEQQAESGLGLDAQHASVVSAAARLGVVLAGVFSDGGTSGFGGVLDAQVAGVGNRTPGDRPRASTPSAAEPCRDRQSRENFRTGKTGRKSLQIAGSERTAPDAR